MRGTRLRWSEDGAVAIEPEEDDFKSICCDFRNNQKQCAMLGEIERIRIFLDVAERSSFAAAARHRGLSRSAVTRAIGELEAELGVQLLVRTTRSVALTAAGAAYFERTRAIALELDRAKTMVREQQGSLRGTMRLSAPLSLGLRFLPDVLAQFRALHPEIAFVLDMTDRFVDILSEPYDMALRISGPPEDKSTIWRKICAVPRVLVASPAYLARHGRPQRPHDLERHDCLGYAHFAGGHSLTLRHAGNGLTETATARHAFTCDNGDMLAEMAVRHAGIVLLPRFIVQAMLEAGRLEIVLEAWRAPEIWLTAYFPPYAALPARVARLTAFIENAAAESRGLFLPD
jgi:DNA-binding transcriptional LysR family regulator